MLQRSRGLGPVESSRNTGTRAPSHSTIVKQVTTGSTHTSAQVTVSTLYKRSTHTEALTPIQVGLQVSVYQSSVHCLFFQELVSFEGNYDSGMERQV